MSVVNAFLFIGLDLTARDKLHDAWHGKNLAIKMTILITAGSLLSFTLNKNSANIALASLSAFAIANITDTIVYNILRRKPYLTRINTSNIASATIDSLVFPIIAFGLPVMWGIVIGQLLAKTIGGFAWALILKKLAK